MDENGISSVLVRGDPAGIVTDRDFRSRVLKAGLGPSTPVRDVMRAPLRTVADDVPIYEAWQRMFDQARTRHLPVTRGGEIVGVVTATDLLKQTAQGPVAVLKRVERLGSRDALPGYAAKVTEMSSALMAGGLDPFVIAGFVARLNDALVVRILRWAEAELGPPPVPYAWMAFGSEGRMEQTMLTDQDNALVYEREAPGAEAWFERLAERAVADLLAAGFPPCPGNCMATRWRGTMDWWTRRFRSWSEEATPKALLQSHIFYDFRRVHGELALDPLVAEVHRAARNDAFRSQMARMAMEFKPPTGLLLRLRGDASAFDIKAHAVTPVVAMARTYAFEVGSQARSTLARLQDAVRAGLMGADKFATVSETYRFVVQLRLREQIRMAAEGLPLSNVISMQRLSSIERSRLRDAFRAIAIWQEQAAYHFHVF
jgi:CBS domain-containing protein